MGSDVLHFSKAGKILYITGTHGTTTGVSGLTHSGMLEQTFYEEDCRKVGVEHGPGPSVLRDIRKPAKRLERLPPGSLYSDPELKKMDIRLANMEDYHDNGQKLVDDIKQVLY